MKKMFLVIILLIIISPVYAVSDITGVTKSKYEETSEEKNIVEIKNLDKNKDFVKKSGLQIQDENGFVLYEFETEGESYIIEGLDQGTYYLVQVDVSNKYILNTKKIKFEVSDGVKPVEIINQDRIVESDDMSNNIILFAFMGMLDLTILIGIIAYAKKNKIKK